MINPVTTVSLRGSAPARSHGKAARRDPARHPRAAEQRRYAPRAQASDRGGFRDQGGATWPNDRFTKRRLADGSIKREESPPDDKNPHHRRSPPSGGDAA